MGRSARHPLPGRALPLLCLALIACGALHPAPAWAGPPFLTDDPEPVELRHWEFYAASQWSMNRHDTSGTCPHFEVNYGALPNVQLHAIVPVVLDHASGAKDQFGVGDIELGTKLRFVQEGKGLPQFPLITLPTGSESRRLGSGEVEVFLPIWVQKSFGDWTTYGGTGLRLVPGANAASGGWLIQRAIASKVTLGAEG